MPQQRKPMPTDDRFKSLRLCKCLFNNECKCNCKSDPKPERTFQLNRNLANKSIAYPKYQFNNECKCDCDCQPKPVYRFRLMPRKPDNIEEFPYIFTSKSIKSTTVMSRQLPSVTKPKTYPNYHPKQKYNNNNITDTWETMHLQKK